MLPAIRIIGGRRFAVKGASALNATVVRSASTWANVPQGPPVSASISLSFYFHCISFLVDCPMDSTGILTLLAVLGCYPFYAPANH